jgi:hypothetical protein
MKRLADANEEIVRKETEPLAVMETFQHRMTRLRQLYKTVMTCRTILSRNKVINLIPTQP